MTEDQAKKINLAMGAWRQGDFVLGNVPEAVHMADLSLPHSPPSMTAAARLLAAGSSPGSRPVAVVDRQTQGHVMLSQTCDIVRDCITRPYVVMAPLVPPPGDNFDDVRLKKRPRIIYVPAAVRHGLVADLDRAMAAEKSVLAPLERFPGWETDEELAHFTEALVLYFSRFAFPDDFEQACRKMKDRIFGKHNRNSGEGEFLRALEEIRVRAQPSWDHEKVVLHWWFVVGKAAKVEVSWLDHFGSLKSRFDQ